MAEQHDVEKQERTAPQETSAREGRRRDRGRDEMPWRVEGEPAGAGGGPSPQMPGGRRAATTSVTANNGVAFFAHVGGFVFGLVATKALVRSRRLSHPGRGTGMTTAG